jgi:hypothetical protein
MTAKASDQPRTVALSQSSPVPQTHTADHSILRSYPAFVLLLAVLSCTLSAADFDLWGHLRFGMDILARSHLIRHDIYAYSIVGLPWTSHEWLSDCILASIYLHLGALGLKLLLFGCAAVTVIGIAAAVAETGASIAIQLPVLIDVVLLLRPAIEFRPQLFTYAFLSILMWLLARDNYAPSRFDTRWLWMMVPVFALWANLHGGFIAGLGVLGIYSAATGVRDLFRREKLGHARLLGVITIVSIAATLATPYGVGTWSSVFRSLSHPAMIAQITEWQPLPAAIKFVWRSSVEARVFDILLVLTGACFAITVIWTPRAGDLPLLAVAILAIAEAISMLRNLPIALIACAAPFAKHLAMATGASSAWRPLDHASGRASWMITQCAIALVAIIFGATAGIFSGPIKTAQIVPDGAIAFMKSHSLRGNVLCKFAWNDYLLFHESPAVRVFIDSRYEMIYPERIALEFEDFYHDRADAARVLEAYPHDFVLLDREAAALKLMDRRADWRPIYRDNIAVLYARTDSAVARTPSELDAASRPRSIFP